MRKFWERAEKLIGIYYRLVEPVMEYPRHREGIAALIGPPTCYGECAALEELESEIRESTVCIVGPLAGEPLNIEGCDVIAAPEGGLQALINSGVKPLYITGDLDVELKYLTMGLRLAKFYAIHVHGDNMERVSWLLSTVNTENIIFTSQVHTVNCTLSIGGFTDGDRAAILAMLLGASQVKLAGFNFEKPTFKHKGATLNDKDKTLKLKLAREILIEASKTLSLTMEEASGELKILKPGVAK
ncbi:MAG: hypothetical protein P3X22_007840 [Thermoprotei archaeon]|nr:hypothetical protein [Thermoprotei archaeon]